MEPKRTSRSNTVTSRFLLSGLDTVEVCYYLRARVGSEIDFVELAIEREKLRTAKKRQLKIIPLGGVEFVLRSNGSANGFPFVIENADYTIEFGEFNMPSFRAKFRSEALWREGADALHRRFVAWAESIGLYALQPETLSRVDFTFDYQLDAIDFDEDSVVSLSTKDNKYRDNGKLNGLVYGKGDVVLRIYDKLLEIEQQSAKHWFIPLWGVDQKVWRIEWQTRQKLLRRFGIKTFDDLASNQGDVLRYLVEAHDTLRVKSDDSNRSRWPLHPLWADLKERIAAFDCQGIWRDIPAHEALNERLTRLAISVYGYLKRIAAIQAVQQGDPSNTLTKAQQELERLIKQIHDPLTWNMDVESRIASIKAGQW